MQYTKKVISHFQHPHNQGNIDNADAVSEVKNPICGDTVKMYLKITNNIIEDIKFEALGCPAAISTTSILTDMVKGKDINDAILIEKSDIVDNLDGLPDRKVHCSVLGIDALRKAIEEYKK